MGRDNRLVRSSPRSEVDRRPDHCEVEPAWRAHIAKDYFAEMQADAGSQLATAGRAPHLADRIEALEPLGGRFKGTHARR